MVLAISILLAGCAADPPATPPPAAGEDAVPEAETPARTQLAALAAAAQDRRLTASYTLSVNGRADRSVTVTIATDGGWRVDVPAGALGGTADVSVARTGEGLFQCALPSADRLVAPVCVRVAGPDGKIPARADPRVQHIFTDWVGVLTDRQAPLAVSVSRPLPGAGGTCFAVESTSASLKAPLEVGIYCFDADGTLTGARVDFGTLVLAGAPSAAPPTVTLPGPVVTGKPLGMATPPPPPSPSPSAAASNAAG